MSSSISSHIRSNVVGYVAVFLALGGVSYAAGLQPNSVRSKHGLWNAAIPVILREPSRVRQTRKRRTKRSLVPPVVPRTRKAGPGGAPKPASLMGWS